ncbi:MAG: hypothetical protein PVH00_01720 [Gemmatimonadota bacterium]
MPRHFGPNITIDGRRLARFQSIYESNVNESLLSIMMFRTGRALIEYIWTAPHRLHIVPFPPIDQNADSTAGDMRHSTMRGVPVYSHGERTGELGSGRGTRSTIRYTPSLFPVELLPRWDRVAMRNWQRRIHHFPIDAGLETDEVLFHELVHAAEHMRGLIDRSPLGHEFDTVAEFHAILVANLLARERNRPARQDHWGHENAESPTALLPDEDEFWRRVEIFRARHPAFAAALARIDIEGNPFGGRAVYRLLHEPWPDELPPF